MNNLWTQISFSTPYEAHLKQHVACVKRGEKCSEIAKGHIFFLITENCSLSELHEIRLIQNIQ